MNLSDLYEEYKQKVLQNTSNFANNPLQVLATALKEGYPTQENPLGNFGGVGSVGRVGQGMFSKNQFGIPQVFRNRGQVAPDFKEGLDLFQISKDWSKVKFPNGMSFIKMKDGTWADEAGRVTFRDTKEMQDSLRDLNAALDKQSGMNWLERDIKYTDPFTDTTKPLYGPY